MISVLDHIEYLITEQDCVIVPGLGAFISQYSKSTFETNDIIKEPERNIVFNRSVQHNDGLLANSISRRECVSYDDANSSISEYICSLKQQLKHEGEVPMGRLGFFSYRHEDVYAFTPFTTKCYTKDFFGLKSLKMLPLSELNRIELNDDNEEQSNIIPFVKRFMQVAASIILLLGMSFVLSTPIVSEHNQDFANLNAFTLKKTVSDEVKGELCIAIPKRGVIDDNIETEHQQQIVNSQSEKEIGRYYLVVASLPNKKLAEKYLNETDNKNCRIVVSKGGMYRVYVARGNYNEMNKLKQQSYSNTDAWVCRN